MSRVAVWGGLMCSPHTFFNLDFNDFQFHIMKQNPRFEHRTVTKFLWWPKTIESTTKWLCRSTWEEARCELYSDTSTNSFNGRHLIGWSNWKPTKWIEN